MQSKPESNRFRRSQIVRLALAAGAGMGGVSLSSRSALATSYEWINSTGGSWSTATNWNPNITPSSDFNNQLLFDTDGTYTTTPDIIGSNGPFNLNSLTVAIPTATNAMTIGVSSVSTDTLVFGPDANGDVPQLLLNSGSLSLSTAFNFAAGSIITNSGSGNLIMGAGTVAQGSYLFGNNTTITNSGTGTVQLIDGIPYNSSGAINLTFANPGGGLFSFGNFAEGISGVLNITGGPVTFAGNTGGNLFGNSLILNVAAGATYNFANNPESMGGFEGAGNIILGTAGGGMGVTEAGNRTFSGTISGFGTVTQDVVNGTLILSGTNTYTGITTVEAFGGVLVAGTNYAFSPNSNINVIGGATLNLGGFNQSIAGLSGGNATGSLPLGSSTLTLNVSSNTTYVFGSPVTGAGSLVIDGTGTQALLGTNNYTGATLVSSGTLIANYLGLVNSSNVTVASGASLQMLVDSNVTNAANFNISGALTKAGAGTLTISSSNPNMNPSSVSVYGGGLVLDHTTDNGSDIGTSSTALVLGSATLQVLGNPSASTSQAFSGTTLAGGANISVVSNGQAASVNIGAIARSAGLGSTVNFSLTNSASGVASVSTTNANGAFNILGGYATVNGTDWATTGTGSGPFNVTPLAPANYSSNSFAATSAATIVHTNVTSSFTAGSNGYTSDIRFNNSTAATTVTVKGQDTIADGGILVTPNVGSFLSTITGSSGNFLTAPSGQDLIVNQYNTKAYLNVSAIINNSAGTPTTTQSQVNITSGASQTITLVLPDTTSSLNLTLGELVTAGSGSGTNLNASANATIVAINPVTNQITVASTGSNILTSTGNTLTFTPGMNVVKSGPGSFNMSGANTYRGLLVLNQGTTTVTATANLGATSSGSSSIYFNGGTLEIAKALTSYGGEGINDWIIGPGGAGVQIDSGIVLTKYGNALWGSGDITVTGGGTFGVGSDGSSFSGRIFVNNGIFRLTSNQVQSCTGITVASGSQYLLDDTASGPFNIAPGSSLVLNGNGPGGQGAWEHETDTGEAGASASYAFNSPIVLQTTSRFNELPQANTSGGALIGVNDIFPYPISGPGNLIKDGQGSLVLSSALNSYGGGTAGTTIISNGTVQLGVTNGVPTGSTIQFGEDNNVNSGTFDMNGFSQTVQNLTVAANTGTSQEILNSSTAKAASVLTLVYNSSSPGNFSGSIGNGGSGNNITLNYTGTGNFTLTGSSSYTGGTNVSAGALTGACPSAFGAGSLLINPAGLSGTVADAAAVNSTNSIGTTAKVTVNSNSPTAIGTLNFYGTSETIGSLAGNGVVVLANSSGTTLTTGLTSSTFAGTMKDGTAPGSLIISGPGSFTLTGSNTYSGQTNVSGGSLIAGAVNSLSPASAVLVSGGTLDVSGFNNSITSLSMTSTGILNLGYGNILTVTGSASLGGTLNLSSGTASGTLPETLITYSSESGTFASVSGTIPSGDQLVYGAGALQLAVIGSGPATLIWTNSTGSGVWDTSTPNFSGGSGPVAYADSSNGATGDTVTFDDTASPNYNVSIATVVHPTSITVNTNSPTGYTFNGSGGIAGAGGLTKLGTGLLTINTSNSYTGGTNISAGRVTLGVAGALPAGGNLTIAPGAALFATNLGTTVALSVGSLSLGGKLDLNNNALVIHNSDVGTVRTLVQSGYNKGSWNNSTGITSLAAATDPSHLTALGVISNDNGSGSPLYGSGGTLAGSFEGSMPVDADVLVKYTYYGDTNLDGKVDGSDYSRIDTAYLADQTNPSAMTGWYNGDFNYDGVINGSDYTLIDNAFNTQGAVLSDQIATATSEIAPAAGTSAVPEPALIGLIGLGALGLLGRRRRV